MGDPALGAFIYGLVFGGLFGALIGQRSAFRSWRALVDEQRKYIDALRAENRAKRG
jgi:hypothetical protein